jgi:hypothetical protein
LSVAIRAHVKPPRAPRWLAALRWCLRGSGLLGCVAGIALTPELVSRLLREGEPLMPAGVESLLAYRALALTAGATLIVVAELLPRLLSRRGDRLLKALAIWLPGAVLAICAALKAVLGPEHGAYTGLAREDGLVEYATSASYLVAGCLAVQVARGLDRAQEQLLAWLWAGLAIALWIVSLEEISWGQRLFELPTPVLLEANVQHEMNLHNLPFVQRSLHTAYIAVGLLGSLAGALLAGRGAARFRKLVRWLAPPGWLLACFLPVALFYLALDYTPAAWVGSDGLRFGFISVYDQEPAELLLSLGFLLFAGHALANLRFGSGARDTAR